jgi:membrane-associated protein
MHHVLSASLSDQISQWSGHLGPWLFCLAVWVLVFAGTGLFVGAFIPFITGDSLVFAAGLVSANPHSGVNVLVMAVGIGLAAWFGDQTGYAIGYRAGRPYLDRRGGSWVLNALRKSESFYQRFGWWSVVISRFMPWARVFVPVLAGVAHMNYYKFSSANLLGAIGWGVGLSVTGYFAATIPAVKNASYGIAAVFIFASVVAGLRNWLKNRSRD